MSILKCLRIMAAAFTLAVVLYAIMSRRSHGRFLGVPFDFRVPTLRRIRERWWNRDDERILTPRVFGVGWSVNLYRVSRLTGLVGGNESGDRRPHEN